MNKVAVTIVCTNQGRFLKEAFDSLEKQTYQDFDIIFYDNACTDDSMEVAHNYYYKNNFLRRVIFSGHNFGLPLPIGITRWDVVQEVIRREYKYIALLDADDLWCNDKLEEQMKVFEENPNIKMVFSDCKYFDDETKEVKEKTFFDKHKPYNKNFFWKLLTKRDFMPCCTLMFEAKALEEVMGKPEAYTSAEDYDWVLKMANKFEVGYVNEPLAYYRLHAKQQTNFSRSRCTAEEIDVVKQACKLRVLSRRQGMRVYLHLLWLYIKLLLKEYQEAEDYLRGLE